MQSWGLFVWMVFVGVLLLSTNGDGGAVPPESVAFSHALINSFLDTVRGPKPAAVDTFVKVSNSFMKKYMGKNATEIKGFNDVVTMLTMVKPILETYAGYTACIVFAFLFIIFMPLVGLFFCLCRCCGKCGGKGTPMDAKNAKCRRATYSMIFVLLVSLMLFFVIIASLNASVLRRSLSSSNEKENTFLILRTNLLEMYTSIQKMWQEIKNGTDTTIKKTPGKVKTIIKSELSDMQKKIIVNSKAIPLTVAIASFVHDMNILRNYSDTAYSELYIELNNATLANKKDELVGFLANSTTCTSAKCAELKPLAEKLVLNFDIQKVGLSLLSQAVQEINRNSAQVDKLLELNTTLYNISDQMKEQIDTQLDSAFKFLEELDLDQILSSVDSTINSVEGMIDGASSTMVNINKEASPISSHVETGIYGVCGFLALVVALYYFGMLFGMCGERPYEDSGVCNRGVGAGLLMAGVGLSFIFFWLLMLLVLLLFLSGGILETEACRYLTGRHPQGAKVIDSYLVGLSGANILPVDISKYSKHPVEGLLNKCKDQSLGDALGVNLSSIVDVKSTLQEKISQMEDELRKALTGNAVFDMSSVEKELEKVTLPTPYPNLTIPLSETKKTVTQIPDIYKFTSVLEQLQTEIPPDIMLSDIIVYLRNKVVAEEKHQTAMHRDIGIMAKTQDSLPKLKDSFKTFSGELQSTVYKVVTEAIMNLNGHIDAIIQDITSDLLNNADCSQLRTASVNMISAVCKNVLYPYNAIWEGIGGVLFFSIVTIIIAVKLVGLYRKKEPYFREIGEPDVGVSQSYYRQPKDDIPMQSMTDKEKQGLSNPGFQGRQTKN